MMQFISGWQSLADHSPENTDFDISVSLIIAFRNEEKNLPGLIKTLENQSFHGSSPEIIFVNDHSVDGSIELLRNFAAGKSNVRLLELEDKFEGKKQALALGAEKAQGELLVFTDADCQAGPDWISTLVSKFTDSGAILLAGPVLISPSKGYFARFQELEQYSLLASTAGSFGRGNPIMLSGANLAIKRTVYLDNLRHLEYRARSGDDMFLLIRLKQIYCRQLFFIRDKKAAVWVDSKNSLRTFLQQRMRWTSKSRFYRDPAIIFSAILVMVINLLILLFLLATFFNWRFLIIATGIFIIKSFADYFLLRMVLRYYNKESLLRNFALSQFLYFLYISITGIGGSLLPSKWKGRKTI